MQTVETCSDLKVVLWNVSKDQHSHLSLSSWQLLQKLIDVWLKETNSVWTVLDTVLSNETLTQDDLGEELDTTGSEEDGVEES